MMMLFRVAMPARPGPADVNDALAVGLDCVERWRLMLMMLLRWVVMPARPRTADGHDACGGLPFGSSC